MVTRCLAIEWAPEGLRVNGIVPGPIDGTEGMARLAPDRGGAGPGRRASVPMRRWGTPGRRGRAPASSSAPTRRRYVNGAIVAADGGWALTGARLDGPPSAEA